MTINTQNNTLAGRAHSDWRPLRDSDLYRNPATLEDIQDLVNDISGDLSALYQQGQIYGLWSLDTVFVDNLGRYHLLPGSSVSTDKSSEQAATYPEYAAFEQMTDDAAWPLGEHTDVYGLGMLLRTLILKTPPLSAMDRLLQDHARLSQDKNLGINRQALRAIDMATGVEINNRLPSMREFVSLLNSAAGGSLPASSANLSGQSVAVPQQTQPAPAAEATGLGAAAAASSVSAAANSNHQDDHIQASGNFTNGGETVQTSKPHAGHDEHLDILSSLGATTTDDPVVAPRPELSQSQPFVPMAQGPANTENSSERYSADDSIYGGQPQVNTAPLSAGQNQGSGQPVYPTSMPAAGIAKSREQALYEEQLAQAQRDEEAGAEEPLSARPTKDPVPQPNYAQPEPSQPKPAQVDGLKMQKAQLKSKKKKAAKLPWIILILIVLLLAGGFLYIHQKGVPEFLARYNIPYLSDIPEAKIPFLSQDVNSDASSSQDETSGSAGSNVSHPAGEPSATSADHTAAQDGQSASDRHAEETAPTEQTEDAHVAQTDSRDSSDLTGVETDDREVDESTASADADMTAAASDESSDQNDSLAPAGPEAATAEGTIASATASSDSGVSGNDSSDSIGSVTQTDPASAGAQGVRDSQSPESIQSDYAGASNSSAPVSAADASSASHEVPPLNNATPQSGAATAQDTTDTSTNAAASVESTSVTASNIQAAAQPASDDNKTAGADQTYVDPKAELQAQNYLKEREAEESKAEQQAGTSDGLMLDDDKDKEGMTETASQTVETMQPPVKAQKPVAKVQQEAAPKKPVAKKPVITTGTVTFNVYPWGNISINGRSYGATPPLRTIKLKPGTYSVTVDNGSDAPVTKSVTVKSGQSVSVSHHF